MKCIWKQDKKSFVGPKDKVIQMCNKCDGHDEKCPKYATNAILQKKGRIAEFGRYMGKLPIRIRFAE